MTHIQSSFTEIDNALLRMQRISNQLDSETIRLANELRSLDDLAISNTGKMTQVFSIQAQLQMLARISAA